MAGCGECLSPVYLPSIWLGTTVTVTFADLELSNHTLSLHTTRHVLEISDRTVSFDQVVDRLLYHSPVTVV